ncbi:MAG: RNA polymerase sigma factor [Myxococcota bacterium]
MSSASAPSREDPHRALVEAALEGDRTALDDLCRGLAGPVYRLALRMLGHPEDAEDAAQEILVKVATHLSSFRGESRVLTWVYTIATRHLLRRQKGRREESLRAAEIAQLIDAGLAITTTTSAPEGDARVLSREVRLACTQSMLFVLSRDERVALILVEVLGASHAVGSEICEVTPETFRQRLSRARGKLRPILEERCGLAGSDTSCRCPRQAAAKQLVGRGASRRWTTLPVVASEEVALAQEQLREAHRAGPVFAWDPPIAPPKSLWQALSVRLQAVL